MSCRRAEQVIQDTRISEMMEVGRRGHVGLFRAQKKIYERRDRSIVHREGEENIPLFLSDCQKRR